MDTFGATDTLTCDSVEKATEPWSCTGCTLVNNPAATSCEVCGTMAPRVARAVAAPPAEAKTPPAPKPSAPHAAQMADHVGVLQKWSESLAAKCIAWEELQVEKQAGWDSAAVEWHWRERDKQFAGNVDRTRNKGLVPSTTKYVRFYREWMPRLSKELFNDDAARVFADIGAAPGGLCEYLVGELGWSGYAFSLAPEAAGFGMSFSHSRLTYRDADFAAGGVWRGLLGVCAAGSCDLVNAGIVVDRGQKALASEGKEGPEREAALRGKSAAADTEGKEGAEVVSYDHLAIFQNEFLFALHALKRGGGLYFAYQIGRAHV